MEKFILAFLTASGVHGKTEGPITAQRHLIEENAEITSRLDNLNEHIESLAVDASQDEFGILEKELEEIQNDAS